MKNQDIEEQSVVLIVDDNPQNLQVLGNLLRKDGYKVAAAQNGALALDFVRKRRPACILLDIMMPEMDGIETCRRLKAEETTRDIPVLFITGLTDTPNKLEAFETGGVDYITKPFQVEEVLARVKTHVALQKMHKRLQAQNVHLQQEIIERKRAETALLAAHEELKRKNAQLQELNASKDKFFSIISHDLKNSFASLLGYTEMLSSYFDTYSQEELKHDIEILRTTTNYLYALLENLLAWSRLQRGLMQYQPEELDIEMIVRENIVLFTSKAEQKQILLTSSVQKNTRSYVDYNMINTVLRNLLSNALKFTNAGGTVNVFVTRTGNTVEIAVLDTGIGIVAADLPKLFRIEDKDTHVGTAGEEGTGLGLILCQELIKQNGGTIRVESEEGKGTTFTFTVPGIVPEKH